MNKPSIFSFFSGCGILDLGFEKAGYDVVFVPNIEIAKFNFSKDFSEYIEQMRELDFHSDIIADLKLMKQHNINAKIRRFL